MTQSGVNPSLFEIPWYQGKDREFRRFQHPQDRLPSRKRRGLPGVFLTIPYLIEQGISKPEQGILRPEQGIFLK